MTLAAAPLLTVVAGPNGAGKSTFTAASGGYGTVPVLDPDALARRLRPDAPHLAATQAGREMIRRQRAYIEGGTSFAIETTLAGTAILRLMEQARAHGFSIHLIYIGINDVQATIDRIAARVARGGHNVPERDARRRYTRSLRHLAAAMERADAVTLIDNSLDRDQRAVLLVDRGQITSRADDMPAWVHIALGGHLWHSEVEPPDR